MLWCSCVMFFILGHVVKPDPRPLRPLGPLLTTDEKDN